MNKQKIIYLNCEERYEDMKLKPEEIQVWIFFHVFIKYNIIVHWTHVMGSERYWVFHYKITFSVSLVKWNL